MIRRDVQAADGSHQWLLISQVEHAHISYELACDWGWGEVAPLEPRDELLAAILHHDDGWGPWEQQPGVDPRSGRPLDFLEMPIGEAIAIWNRSIDECEPYGPLAAYLVSSHFSALVDRAHPAHAANPQWLEQVDRFLDAQRANQHQWLAAWSASAGYGDNSETPRQIAARGLSQLQLFDALSLWLCMAERTEPAVFPTPDGPDLTWNPASPAVITVSPWPWRRGEFSVQATGRLVAARPYASREELAAAPGQRVIRKWKLRPAG